MASMQRKIRKATRFTGKMLGTMQVLLRKLSGLLSKMTKKTTKKLLNYLRRSLVKKSHRPTATSGFVLPTVTMVLLVVALLTTAMVLRSFDRSKNAANFRVNEATLNAAAPALDRARAKIDELFNDPTLPRGTPSDDALIRALTSTPERLERYRFGDETQLKLVYDVDDDNNVGEADTDSGSAVEDQETVTTAWKFPIDTDNNGRFDTFTLYAIVFRSPPRDSDGFTRRRNPLDARTRPMDEGQLGRQCETSVTTSASFVGDSGWYRSGNTIKKGIFVYAANVPITDLADLDPADFEEFSGASKGFSAIEYQQDRSRIPLTNNAVVYRDDLNIFPGTRLNLNGRVITNSNLLIGNNEAGSDVRLFLVSSPDSCYYREEMSKVLVGGNIGAGLIGANNDTNNADIDLFGISDPFEEEQNFGRENKTVTATGGRDISYNTFAFNQRIDYMVNAALWRGNGSASVITARTNTDEDPEEVQDRVEERLEENPGADPYEVRQEELENYFIDRTRQVPFREVPDGESALLRGRATLPSTSAPDGITITNEAEANAFFAAHTEGADTTGQNPLRPPFFWMYPFNQNNNTDSYTGLTQRLAQPPATDPAMRNVNEERVGDRVLVGNNLPAKIFDPDSNEFVDAANYEQVVMSGGSAISWDGSGEDRIRNSQVQELPDLGITDRDNFWEVSAAEAPASDLDNIGGLRVITGTGIYLPEDGDITVPAIFPPADGIIPRKFIIWPDYMPMAQGHDDVWDTNGKLVQGADPAEVDNVDNDRPYLRMRATAVYHYARDSYDGTASPVDYQEPMACVSSYYDPTDEDSAENQAGLALNPAAPGGTGGNSNNGVVYEWSDTLGANRNILNYQAELVYPKDNFERIDIDDADEFPDLRYVNPLLRTALETLDVGGVLSLAERTTLDTAICALNILNNAVSRNTAAIEDGTIFETTFLDARQVKAIDAHSLRVRWNGNNYEFAEGLFGDGLETPDLEDGDIVTLAGFDEDPGENLNFSRKEIDVNPDGTFTVLSTTPPNGAAKIGWLTETLSGRYDLSIEERQPLEIRATVLDVNQMRNQTVGSATPTEYLLPNSGIVYATREDALADETTDGDDGEPNQELSATDFLLDPTRRPNAIMLINGAQLNRGGGNNYIVQEKGLVLVTPLPVYIRGDFNLHTGGSNQEFTEVLADDWNNFYNRTTLNDQFACRVGQFGGSSCSPGDRWRAATVISDALTLLSDDFREGFRNEGDYDLNNNLGDAVSIRQRRENGFYTNDFVTSNPFTDGEFSAAVGGPRPISSSYFNNFVTPIQRRPTVNREYLMEVCPKRPVSACGPMDWYITPPGFLGDPLDPATAEIFINGIRTIDMLIDTSGTSPNPGVDPAPAIALSNVIGQAYNPATMLSGTTIIPAGADLAGDDNITADFTIDELAQLRRYPRRVAFLRDYRSCTPPAVSALEERLPDYPEGTRTVLAAPNLRTCDGDLILDNGNAGGLAAAFLVNNDRGGANQPIPIGLVNDQPNGGERGTIEPFPYFTTALDINRDEDADEDAAGTPLRYCGWNEAARANCANLSGQQGIRPFVSGARETLWFRTTATLNGGGQRNDLPVANNYGHAQPLFYRTLDGQPISNNPIGEPEPVEPADPTEPEDPVPGRKWQPLLEPVVQLRATINTTAANTGNLTRGGAGNRGNRTHWQQQATDGGNTFNVVFSTGDTPGRPNEGNGGFPNFPRFLEAWDTGAISRPARISGGFLQTKRSVYATAPFLTLLPDALNGTYDEEAGIFGENQRYNHDNGGGILPFYNAPERLWGFDVGLLTQQPDLFAQRFTVPPTSDPNEFFREVGRDDRWVQVLLCANQPTQTPDGTPIAGGYDNSDTNTYYNEPGVDHRYAVSEDQRPDDCNEAVGG